MGKLVEILCVNHDVKGFSHYAFSLISECLKKTFYIIDEGPIVDEELVNMRSYREIDFFKNDEYRFVVNDNEHEDIYYFIDIKKRTINDNCNIFFTVYFTHEGDERNPQLSVEEYLYRFKIELKNLLIDLFDKCYWIYDQQVEQMCGEAYALVNRAENMFRTFIVNFMITQYGIHWWESVTKGIKGKLKREDEYSKLLVDFKGINLEMYNLDIKDLAKLVDNQYNISLGFKLNSNKELPSDERERLNFIKKELKHFSDTVLKDVELQVEIEKSFWEHDISTFFINKMKFKEKWDNICENRNHIAHNKVIDRPMYEKICEDSRYIIGALESALTQIQISIPSQETISLSSRKQNIEEEEYIYSNLSDFGHGVKNEKDITEYLDSYLYETYISPAKTIAKKCGTIKEFSIPYTSINDFPTNEYGYIKEFKFIYVKDSEDNEYSLTIEDVSIHEEFGSTSSIYLVLYVNGEEQDFAIEHINPNGDWDSEEGYFVVTGDGGFNDNAVYGENNLIIEELKSFLA